MTRYAMIDYSSGYVWGIAESEDPIEACRTLDDAVGGRMPSETTYTERNWFEPVIDGYDVYEVPAGFDVDDGQDQQQIEKVAAMKRVARIETRWIGSDEYDTL